LEILSDYDRDFAKHAHKSMVPRLRAIWRSMPAQLAKEDKRFVAAEVVDEEGEKMRSRDLKDPFEWLEAAGVAYRVWNVKRPNMPLDAYRSNVFKLFGVDVGLVGAQSHLDARSIVEGNQIFTEFKGALTEQFVQQEMRAEADIRPFYWSSEDSRTEIDFIAELDDLLVPVEVKAERNLRAKSLKRFMERFSQKTAVRTSMSEWQECEGLVDMPLYMIGQIGRIRR
jgi:predicted AAA+ superfamily ATPase